MPRLLLFHANIFKAEQIRQIADRLGIDVQLIPADQHRTRIGELAGMGKNLTAAPHLQQPAGMPVTQEMMLICGLSDDALDALLAAFRTANVKVDLKAVLTPMNSGWNAEQLFAELVREHAFFQNTSPKN